MGSTSDMPVMESAAKFFDEMEIPFEINALSAHRTPEKVEEFAKNAHKKGITPKNLFMCFNGRTGCGTITYPSGSRISRSPGRLLQAKTIVASGSNLTSASAIAIPG